MKPHYLALAPLLAGASRSALAPEPSGRRDFSGVTSPEWQALLELASRHQLAALLARGLRNCGIEGPEVIREELRLASRVGELRADRAAWQLQEIIARFAAGGITPLVLKGAALAFSGYPAAGMRSFSDLDLLVRPSDREGAAALLAEACLEPPGGARPDWWSEHHHHWVFVRPGALPVELHWDLTPPGSPVRLPLERFWERSQPFPLDRAARVLAPEDELLHLAVHACKHRLRVPLRVFADARVLLGDGEACDLRRLEYEARAAGALTDLRVVLAIAGRLGFLNMELSCSRALTTAPEGTDCDALAAYMVLAPFEEWSSLVTEGLASGKGGLRGLVRRLLRPGAGASECRRALGRTPCAPVKTSLRARRALKSLPALLRPSASLRGAAAALQLFGDREAP